MTVEFSILPILAGIPANMVGFKVSIWLGCFSISLLDQVVFESFWINHSSPKSNKTQTFFMGSDLNLGCSHHHFLSNSSRQLQVTDIDSSNEMKLLEKAMGDVLFWCHGQIFKKIPWFCRDIFRNFAFRSKSWKRRLGRLRIFCSSAHQELEELKMGGVELRVKDVKHCFIQRQTSFKNPDGLSKKELLDISWHVFKPRQSAIYLPIWSYLSIDQVVQKLAIIADLQTARAVPDETEDMRDEDLGILSMMHGANITKSKARWDVFLFLNFKKNLKEEGTVIILYILRNLNKHHKTNFNRNQELKQNQQFLIRFLSSYETRAGRHADLRRTRNGKRRRGEPSGFGLVCNLSKNWLGVWKMSCWWKNLQHFSLRTCPGHGCSTSPARRFRSVPRGPKLFFRSRCKGRCRFGCDGQIFNSWSFNSLNLSKSGSPSWENTSFAFWCFLNTWVIIRKRMPMFFDHFLSTNCNCQIVSHLFDQKNLPKWCKNGTGWGTSASIWRSTPSASSMRMGKASWTLETRPGHGGYLSDE